MANKQTYNALSKDEIAFLRQLLKAEEQGLKLQDHQVKRARQIIKKIGTKSYGAATSGKAKIAAGQQISVKARRKAKHDKQFKAKAPKVKKAPTPQEQYHKAVKKAIKKDPSLKKSKAFHDALDEVNRIDRRNRFIERLETYMEDWNSAWNIGIQQALDAMDNSQIYKTMKKLGLRSCYYDSEFFGNIDIADGYQIYATILQDAGMKPMTREESEEIEAELWNQYYMKSDLINRDMKIFKEATEALKNK